MKEKYEALKMEIVAFDGNVFTDDAYSFIIVSRDDYVPGNNNGPYVVGEG